jgi:hypothetical protein
VHFYSNFFRKTRSNRGIPTRLSRAPAPAPPYATASASARACRLRPRLPQAALGVRSATWGSRVRRRLHTGVPIGPSVLSPCQARRPRSWTLHPPRQPCARTRGGRRAYKSGRRSLAEGGSVSPCAMSTGAVELPPPRSSAANW